MNIVLLPKTTMQQKTRVGKTVDILFPDGEYSFLTQLKPTVSTSSLLLRIGMPFILCVCTY
jgi:hypothetical protein